MAWSGELHTVTPLEIRGTLKLIAPELGLVVTCPCGGARYCPGTRATEDAFAFYALHRHPFGIVR